MASPSHHRDLSPGEKARVVEVLRTLDNAVLQLTDVHNDLTVAHHASTVLPSPVSELLQIVDADKTLCAALVKTTRIVPILRRLMDLHVDVQLQLQQLQHPQPVESSTFTRPGDGNQGSSSIEASDAATGAVLTSPPRPLEHVARNEDERRGATLGIVAEAVASVMPPVARLLHVLVSCSHSRRAFFGFLPPHSAKGFLDLLHHAETLSDAVKTLSHVLLFTQEGKEVLDALVAPPYCLIGHLQRVVQAAVIRGGLPLAANPLRMLPQEVERLTDAVALLTTVVSVTPRPDSQVFDAVQALCSVVLVPFIAERGDGVWLPQILAGTHELEHAGGAAATTAAVTALHDELIQLSFVLELEGHPSLAAQDFILARWCVPQRHLAAPLASSALVQLWVAAHVSSAANISSGARGGTQLPHDALREHASVVHFSAALQRARSHLHTIRRQNLDSDAVRHALVLLHRDISSPPVSGGGPQWLSSASIYSFVVGHIPGGIKTLYGTLSTVDEESSSLSCAVLTSLLNHANSGRCHAECYQYRCRTSAASTWTTSTPTVAVRSATRRIGDGNPERGEGRGCVEVDPDDLRHPIYQFVALDGVLLLADMLDDYSDDVLSGAFGLLRSVLSCLRAVDDVLSSHVLLKKIRHLTSSVAERLLQLTSTTQRNGDPDAGDGGEPVTEVAPLAAMSALCAECVARLPREACEGLLRASVQPSMTDILRSWWRALSLLATAAGSTAAVEDSSLMTTLQSAFLKMCANIAHVDRSAVHKALFTQNTAPSPGPSTSLEKDTAAAEWLELWPRIKLETGKADEASVILCSELHLISAIWTDEGSHSRCDFNAACGSISTESTAAALSGDDNDALLLTAALIHIARVAFALPPYLPAAQRCWTQFWSVVRSKVWCPALLPPLPSSLSPSSSELLRGHLAALYDDLRAALLPSCIGCLHTIAGTSGSIRDLEPLLEHVLSVLRSWGCLSAESVTSAICQVAVHSNASTYERWEAVHVLLDLLRDGVSIPTPYWRPRDTAPLLLTRVILQCEEVEEGEAILARQLANVCFERLLADAASTMVTLVRVGRIAVHVVRGGDAEPELSLGWLGTLSDPDDAHDTLVAVVPIMNGALNRTPNCRESIAAVDEAGGALDECVAFCVELLGCGGGVLEIPLRVLATYALFHLTDDSGESSSRCSRSSSTSLQRGAADEANSGPQRIAARLVEYYGIYSLLDSLLVEAHDPASLQPADALVEIRSACCTLAERLAMIHRQGGSETEASLAPGSTALLFALRFAERWGAAEPFSCSLLLTVLQNDDARAHLRNSGGEISTLYCSVLQRLRHALHTELAAADPSSSEDLPLPAAAAPLATVPVYSDAALSRAYYALLQVEKYVGECASMAVERLQ